MMPRLYVYLLSLLVLVLLAALPVSAASLTISPNTIENTYTGKVTMTVTGLSAGQPVTLETYLDVNSNGAVDANEPLLNSAPIADGQTTMVAGQRVTNFYNDDDATINSQLKMVLDYASQSLPTSLAWKYVVLVNNAAGATIAQAPFTITQHHFGQAITGKVTSNGTAVPNAIVYLSSGSTDNAYMPCAGTLTDSQGNYTLQCAPGAFHVASRKLGYVTQDEVGLRAPTIVRTGQSATKNLTLTLATRTITGKVVDKATNTGLAGITVTAFDYGTSSYVVVLTDRQGNFLLPVTPSKWLLSVTSNELSLLKYLAPTYNLPVDTRGGNATGQIFTCQKVAVLGLVRGVLKGRDNVVQAGVPIHAFGSIIATTVTDATGTFMFGIVPGSITINVDQYLLAQRDYGLKGMVAQTSVSANQAVTRDIIVDKFTAHLRGTVRDNAATPAVVPFLPLNASTTSNPLEAHTGNVMTAENGTFDIGVFAGSYQLGIDGMESSARGLFGTARTLTVVNGVDQNSLVITLKKVTSHIRGKVIDNVGAVIPYLPLEINGGTNAYLSYLTAADGTFDLPVIAGTWQVDTGYLTQECREIFGTATSLTTTDNANLENRQLVFKNHTSHITGTVKDRAGNPLIGAIVMASATSGGKSYDRMAMTDMLGQYDLAAIAGSWSLDVYYGTSLQSLTFPSQTVTVASANVVRNFVAAPYYQPDLMVRSLTETAYTGEYEYLMEATSKTITTAANVPAIFILKVRNNGETSDTITVTGNFFATGWTAKYFNAPVGGSNITSTVESGWTIPLAVGQSKEFRLELTPTSSVTVGNSAQVYLMAESAQDPQKMDMLTAVAQKSTLSSVRLVADPASPSLVNTKVTLRAVPSGGQNVEYMFKVGYNENNVWNWTTIQNYAASLSCSWTPTVARTYTVVVYAREKNTTSFVYDSQYYKVMTPLTGVNTLTATPSSPRAVFTPVIFAATTNGGAKVEYQFKVGYNNNGTYVWTIIRDFDLSNIANWIPTEVRTYVVVVTVRERGATTTFYKSMNFNAQPIPLTAVNLSANKTSPQPAGTAIQLTASATGGAAEYQFKLVYSSPSGTQQVELQAYGTNNTITWTPTEARSYTVYVYARTMGRTNSYDVYKAMTFKIQ